MSGKVSPQWSGRALLFIGVLLFLLNESRRLGK